MSALDPKPVIPLLEEVGPETMQSSGFEVLLDVSMPVAIEIGRANMTVHDILHLAIGSVIQLDRIVGEPVDIYVSDRRFAQGEVVVVGEHFGVRITRVLSGLAGDDLS